jgi:hypothetical protein
MFKWILLAVAACLGAWYYLIDGRKLDEQMVRNFYQQQEHATYSRDPEALCAQYAKKLVATQETRMSGQTTSVTLDQKQACDKLRETFQFFEQAGEKAGGILTIEYAYELHQIDIAPDRKSATVQFSSVLKMGEAFMQFTTTSTERLERSMREVQLARADVKTRVAWTPGALLNPEKYFRAQ